MDEIAQSDDIADTMAFHDTAQVHHVHGLLPEEYQCGLGSMGVACPPVETWTSD